MSILQDRIKTRRTMLNKTLLELAEEIGVKEATVQRYESGEIKNIKHDTINKLAEALDCSPCYLMGWQNSPVDYDNIDKKIASLENQLSEKQQKAVELFMNLPDDLQDKALDYIQYLAFQENK